MITVTVEVTAECEELLTRLPRGYEYDLSDEDYREDGSGTVKFIVHDVDDMTRAMELALDTHPDVIAYTVQ